MKHSSLSKDTYQSLVALKAALDREGAPPRVPPVDLVKIMAERGPDADLQARNFDGLTMEYVDFGGADLRGANMSECTIRDCNFEDADLMDVCFAETIFEDCNFSGAQFGGTLMMEASFSGCRFSGPSALMLPWGRVHLGPGNIWIPREGFAIPFTTPPVVLSGLPEISLLAVIGGRVVIYDSYSG